MIAKQQNWLQDKTLDQKNSFQWIINFKTIK